MKKGDHVYARVDGDEVAGVVREISDGLVLVQIGYTHDMRPEVIEVAASDVRLAD